MPKGIALTPEEQDRRRQEIFEAVVDTFIEKGFVETSMREIAELAGMGKSSLYDYFATKDEILVFVMESSLRFITDNSQRINAQSISAEARLRQIIEMHLEYVVSNKKLFYLFSYEGRRLSLDNQKRMQQGRYAYQDMLRGLIEEGITEGIFRPVDALLAARMLINTLIPVVFTSRPTGSPQEMMRETLDIFLNGIQSR
ncbi:MAG: TetR/AcrR family transcriptional regulator, cholesterol catabolism regulator [Chloroflexota bacterium]|nr:TetR/AcrR family transcriptional regulator, cholesterol catabolism regulator [Chloroflexota bacterium]